MRYIYNKSYMIFQFTPCHWNLGGIEMSNQGHWVFIGLCIIYNVLLDSGAVRPRGLLFGMKLLWDLTAIPKFVII